VIAAAGYAHVETYGPFHDDPSATRRLLDARGLTAKSAHIDLETLESEPSRAPDIAATLGLDFVVAPYLPEARRPTTIDGWKAFGSRLSRVGEKLSAHGVRFAWHNHDFEFAALPDGSLPIEHLLGDALLWEADLAWVTRAGADPFAWIARYGGRIPLVHVKDIAPPGDNLAEEGWADVGAGVLPWRDLWARCIAAGAEVMVAEHDRPRDFARFAQVSADAMRGFDGRDAK
jgi:sugar phosphate isomerase/epimerase